MSPISLDDINKLSVAERLELLEKVWDSLVDAPTAMPLTDAQRREIDGRLEHLDRNPNSVESWEQVEAYVRGRKKHR